MLRFGKTLGILDRDVTEIKLLNSADPDVYERVLKGDEKAKKIIKEVFKNKSR